MLITEIKFPVSQCEYKVHNTVTPYERNRN